MTDSALLWGSALFFFSGILLIAAGSVFRSLILQKIENTPTSKIRSAAVGLVEIYGKAETKNKMLSPVSKEKCAYWEILARTFNRNTREEGKQFYHARSPDLFYVDDGSGEARVGVEDALILLPWSNIYEGWLSIEKRPIVGKVSDQLRREIMSEEAKRIDKRVLEFINKRGNESAKGRFFRKKNSEIRVYEKYIPLGSKVYVIGSATKDGDVLNIQKGIENILFISNSKEKDTVMQLERPMERWIYWGAFISFIGLIGIISSIL